MEEQPGIVIQKSSGSILQESLIKVRPQTLIPASRRTTSEAVAMERDLQLSSGARQLEMSVILTKRLNHNHKLQKLSLKLQKVSLKHKKVSKYENSFNV